MARRGGSDGLTQIARYKPSFLKRKQAGTIPLNRDPMQMPEKSLNRTFAGIGFEAWSLVALIVLVTLAGGASFPDALGQAVVRTGAMLLAAIVVASGARMDFTGYRAPASLVLAAIILVAVQLVPLPPGLWRQLPGRAAFDVSVMLPELATVWRPAAIVPDAAWNALFALTVPVSALIVMAAVPRSRLGFTVPLVVAMVFLSSVMAALQFAGTGLNNPLINERVGFASGLLANRNHQALFLSIGIAAAMHWGAGRPLLRWRVVAAACVVGWFVLMILATGSRAGLILGIVALVAGGLLVFASLRGARVRIRPKAALLAGGFASSVVAAIVMVSLYAGRSESIGRLSEADVGEDMRFRALPVVWDMVRAYMPIGAGQGGFGTLFRVAEPDNLLKPTYFNRAHSDIIEVLFESGFAGALLLAGAVFWYIKRTWRVWRARPSEDTQRARLGAVVILLILLASVADYPARTPVIMTMLILAAGWLCRDPDQPTGFTR